MFDIMCLEKNRLSVHRQFKSGDWVLLGTWWKDKTQRHDCWLVFWCLSVCIFSLCLLSMLWSVLSMFTPYKLDIMMSVQRFCALQGGCVCAVMKDGTATGLVSLHHEGPQAGWHHFIRSLSLSSCLQLSFSLLFPPFFVSVAPYFGLNFSLLPYHLLFFFF